MNLNLIFWILLSIIFYSYFGYLLILFLINIFVIKKKGSELTTEPDVTIFISAYNEEDIVDEKVQNTFALDYPKEKTIQVWVTDGSTDTTVDKLKKYPEVIIHHENERKGKTSAINRGMQFVKTPIIIFTDANTLLSQSTVKEIVRQFNNPRVGCVAGEKRIKPFEKDNAVHTGEGIYWLIESKIKYLESNINSVLGAAGELFAIRKELFCPIEPDTILDDFILSLKIAKKGYKIKYAPNAFSYETGSASISEELKRKTRIAAGCFQSLGRVGDLLNPIKYKFLSFQFFSHKILRWIAVPLAQIVIFFVNLVMIYPKFEYSIYSLFFAGQLLFYLFVLFGGLLRNSKIRFKIIFTPFYAFMMNYAILVGLFRYFNGNYSVKWEKASRG